MTSPFYFPKKPKQAQHFAKYTEGQLSVKKKGLENNTKEFNPNHCTKREPFSEKMRVLLLTEAGRKTASFLDIPRIYQIAMGNARRDANLPWVPE